MKFNTPYERQKSKRQVKCGQGLTEQAHKDACDMNLIVRDYERTRILKHQNASPGRYADVSAVDFQTAMDTVLKVNNCFYDLPSSVRKQFNNDPAEFLEYAQDEGNLEEMKSLGIAIDLSDIPDIEKPVENQEVEETDEEEEDAGD